MLTTAAMIDNVRRALDSSHGVMTEAEAASLVHLSESRFRHVFKAVTGASFRSARVDAKLHYAQELLLTTAFTIPEISDVLEYADRTKFERSFKRYRGVTPARYRELPSDSWHRS